MKWQWETVEEKRIKLRRRLQGWHRRFALFPIRDYSTRTTYWMQYVWRRAVEFRSDTKDADSWQRSPESECYVIVTKWEYREGNRRAPFIKSCPAGMAPSIVQDGLPDVAAVKPDPYEGWQAS